VAARCRCCAAATGRSDAFVAGRASLASGEGGIRTPHLAVPRVPERPRFPQIAGWAALSVPHRQPARGHATGHAGPARTATRARIREARACPARLQACAGVRVELSALLALVMVALVLDARRWVRLAARSRVGARSEEAVRHALDWLEAEGWRLRHSLLWGGRGDIDSVAIAPTGAAFAIETKTRTFDSATWPTPTTRPRAFTDVGGVGGGAARSRSCASCVPAGWRGSRTGFLWSRVIAWFRFSGPPREPLGESLPASSCEA
jgi:hypothetical protein